MTYKNRFLRMIHLRLIRNGKKELAYRILRNSLNHIKNKTKKNPLLTINKAIKNTTPSVKLQTRRIRGSIQSIPVELSGSRGIAQSIRWIIASAKKKNSGNTFGRDLANEFLSAAKKAGNAFRKKKEIKKIADENIRGKRKKKKKRN